MDLKSPNTIGTDTDRILQEHRLADSPSKAPVLSDSDLDALFALDEDDLPTLPSDLSGLAIEELRSMCNRMFREMNKNFPRFGAREDYGILFDELHYRSGQQP